jgi:hypothetical protein
MGLGIVSISKDLLSVWLTGGFSRAGVKSDAPNDLEVIAVRERKSFDPNGFEVVVRSESLPEPNELEDPQPLVITFTEIHEE